METLEREGGGLVPLLTTTAVAQVLGVHPETVTRLRKAGDIPFVWVGGSLRFRADDIEAYVQSLTSERRDGPLARAGAAA
jgi:excisionase family DNA binding protein